MVKELQKYLQNHTSKVLALKSELNSSITLELEQNYQVNEEAISSSMSSAYTSASGGGGGRWTAVAEEEDDLTSSSFFGIIYLSN